MGSKLKTNFKVQNRYGAFYTGGKVQFSKDGDYMFCQNGDQIHILEVKNGQLFKTIGQEGEDEVTSFVLSPDDKMLVVAGKSLLLRQVDWRENTVTRTWKAIHFSPVSCMSFDVTSTLLATGGSDSTIKIWDVIKQYCTHNLKGHTGVISVAEFHPDIDKLQLFSAGEDYKVRVWDLKTSVCVSVLEHHFSLITSIVWTADLSTLFCGSRDNTVSVWNLQTMNKQKTIPVYEGVEGLVVVPELEDASHLGITSPDHVHVITAGAKGSVKVWDSITGQCVYTLDLTPHSSTEQSNSQQAVSALLYNPALATVSIVTYDHNIIMYKLQDLTLYKQFVGYHDEILDVRLFGQKDSHLAVASNSDLVKVYTLESWDCQILRGHSNTVLSLDIARTKDYLVSASKDNTVRVWHQDKVTGNMSCVAIGHGHTNSVQAVAFSRLNTSFIVSGSQDLTLKLWSLPANLQTTDPLILRAELTEKAHDKDINAIVVSPNDKLIATGSQDKTTKLWKREDLSLVGVFRGHKRGIWCVQFSPVDQCVATSSADGTVKIWALSDFTCVKTFEGHDCSVLKVMFVSKGMQLLSTGSDGLLKLWTIKSSECVKTFDEHEDKTWALEVSQDETTLITGASDSNILVWKDVTVEEQEEVREKQEQFILKSQELENLLHHKKYLKALCLAISLDQPFRVLGVIKDILAGEEGKHSLDKTISKLESYHIDAILRYVGTWNTNSKHCFAAQSVLSIILKTFSPEELFKLANFKSSLEGLLPYTERHCARMRRLEQQTTFVDYTWQCMRPVTDYRDSEIMTYDDDLNQSQVKRVLTQSGSEVKGGKTSKTEKDLQEHTKMDDSSSSSSDESSSDDMDISSSMQKTQKLLSHKLGESDSSGDQDQLGSDSESDHVTDSSRKKQPAFVVDKKTIQENLGKSQSRKNVQEKSPNKTIIHENREKSPSKKAILDKPEVSPSKKTGVDNRQGKQSVQESTGKSPKKKSVDTRTDKVVEITDNEKQAQKGRDSVKGNEPVSKVNTGDKKNDSQFDIEVLNTSTPLNKKLKKKMEKFGSHSDVKENVDTSSSDKKCQSARKRKVKVEVNTKRTRSGSVDSDDESHSESDMTLRKVAGDIEAMDTEDIEEGVLKTPYTTFKLTGRTPGTTGRITHKVKGEDERKNLAYTDPVKRTRSDRAKKTLRSRKLKTTKK